MVLLRWATVREVKELKVMKNHQGGSVIVQWAGACLARGLFGFDWTIESHRVPRVISEARASSKP